VEGDEQPSRHAAGEAGDKDSRCREPREPSRLVQPDIFAGDVRRPAQHLDGVGRGGSRRIRILGRGEQLGELIYRHVKGAGQFWPYPREWFGVSGLPADDSGAFDSQLTSE